MTVNLAQPGLLVSLPGILIVAVVAGRLLGVRRSVVANLVSGLVGWLCGVALSEVIAHGHVNPVLRDRSN
ncbi:MAG: hypothetical protein E6F99_17495 [Actinobacteria bacterium]|nr:MAG: hypothetical protein E6F99_17495 [Actinomycetota bacterium]